MIIAITGTPGTGKTSVSKILKDKDFEVVDLNKLVVDEDFLDGFDKKRDSKIVDLEKLNNHIKTNYNDKDLVFLEGHLSHLLKNVDKIIIFRCHPVELRKRLSNKKWKKEKISENVESEILDIILCEANNLHPADNIFEIDTTNRSIDDLTNSIIEIVENGFKPMKKYNMGKIDWSEEILK
jgi:adenylate kinase